MTPADNKVDQVDINVEQELKELYGAIKDVIDQTIITGEDEKTTMTFFIMASWFPEAFDYYPYLNITSPTPGSGKSTCLEVIGALALNPLMASNATPPAIFRALAKEWTTLLLDEADNLGLDRPGDLAAILNSGHKRSTANVVRCKEEDRDYVSKSFFTGGFKVIAGLPAGMLKTLQSRSIEIIMQTKLQTQKVTRLSRLNSNIIDTIKTGLTALRESPVVIDRLRQTEGPDVFDNRVKDKWEALLLVAELIGSPEKDSLLNAARNLEDDVEEPDVAIQLLSDIKQVLHELKTHRIQSDHLHKKLLELRNGEWRKYDYGRGLLKPELQKRIRSFGVKTEKFKLGGKTVTGYNSHQFHDAWNRYLPEDTSTE